MNIILPTGQSGQFMSDHFKDMSAMWLKGKYIKINLREDEFIKRSKFMMKLIPQ
jgi:acyl-homoserine lactone acylase PvdQ